MEIDAIAERAQVTILQLPPYHPDLNPIEMVWGVIKNKVRKRNTSFRIKDVLALTKQAYSEVTAEDWQRRIQHTIKLEDYFAMIDNLDDQAGTDVTPPLTAPGFESGPEDDTIDEDEEDEEDEEDAEKDEEKDEHEKAEEAEKDEEMSDSAGDCRPESPSFWKILHHESLSIPDENNNLEVASSPLPPSFPCKICQKICRTKTDLFSHEKTHSKEGKVCHICGKLFEDDQTRSAAAKLSRHTKTCSGGAEKTKTCSMCGKNFARNRNLKRHEPNCSPKWSNVFNKERTWSPLVSKSTNVAMIFSSLIYFQHIIQNKNEL